MICSKSSGRSHLPWLNAELIESNRKSFKYGINDFRSLKAVAVIITVAFLVADWRVPKDQLRNFFAKSGRRLSASFPARFDISLATRIQSPLTALAKISRVVRSTSGDPTMTFSTAAEAPITDCIILITASWQSVFVAEQPARQGNGWVNGQCCQQTGPTPLYLILHLS